MVRTCIGFDWDQIDSIESEAYVSLFLARPIANKPTLLRSRGTFDYEIQSWREIIPHYLSAATEARCHYVNRKWLGGMLTNWSTTETRLQKFKDLKKRTRYGTIQSTSKKRSSYAQETIRPIAEISRWD